MTKSSHAKDPVLVAVEALGQTVEKRFEALGQTVDKRFDTLDQKVDHNHAEAMAKIASVDQKVDRNHEEVKEHFGMQDAYMRQSFDRITDTLDYEERIRQNERDIADLKRLVAAR